VATSLFEALAQSSNLGAPNNAGIGLAAFRRRAACSKHQYTTFMHRASPSRPLVDCWYSSIRSPSIVVIAFEDAGCRFLESNLYSELGDRWAGHSGRLGQPSDTLKDSAGEAGKQCELFSFAAPAL
jgi:hypothetical protein